MGKHETDSDAWKDLLRSLGIDGQDQYEPIPAEEIERAREHNPQRADLMEMANIVLDAARQRSEGEVKREPEIHDVGWHILFETDGGPVGLWSCWLGNHFYIGYPSKVQITSSLIKQTLQVKDACPVKFVAATAVNNWKYEGEYADDNKPLEQNQAGQIIGYQDKGERQWAQYYGPIENGDGRVWISQEEDYYQSVEFRYLSEDRLETVGMGHSHCMSVSTFPFSFHNKYSYEGPTAGPEAIQTYRDKFIRLAAEIAGRCGRITAVHIDYGFALVPEDLQKEGYVNIGWKRGNWGRRSSWGEELVVAQKDGNDVAIVSGNTLVPWVTVVKYPVENENAKQLADRIVDELLTI